MQAHTVERVESWGSRPFSNGIHDLQDLATDDFSGAAVANGVWLFMLNGRVVGVYEGDIEDFEDASGTIYDAPHPSLPLLFSMRERGGETQAKYYSNDTPLSEVDDTLSSGNFTGYVELSENVLSGDYFVVYYGGRSMSAAFVGASEELIAGEDAFERANDEVGVYEVCKTGVDVTDLETVAGATEQTSDTQSESNTTAESEANGDDAASNTSVKNAVTETASDDTQSPERTYSPDGQSTEQQSPERQNTEQQSEGGSDDEQSNTATTVASEASTRTRTGSESTTNDSTESSESSAPTTSSEPRESDTQSSASGPRSADETVFDNEEQWQNARSVPTLDPKQSEDSGDVSKTSGDARAKSNVSRETPSNRARSTQSPDNTHSTVEKLKIAVQRRNEKLEAAGTQIEALEDERDEFQERTNELEQRIETLQNEREELQTRIEELVAQDMTDNEEDTTSSSSITLGPESALSDTNLFVRYESKGKPTLDELDSETDADAVNKNLRIDHHTKFDAENAVVDGEPFDSFLAATSAYRFVSWAVRELPYEIRDAGHTKGLSDLYAVLPRVDRAELSGTVELTTEDNESVSQRFDVVLRDRMGDALVVAELNESRNAVTGDEMDSLVEATSEIRGECEDLSSAMYVTASFFDPRALESASDAAEDGGFLNRSDKESYVRTSRKEGYHLCLVEDRNDAFHLTVPEL